MRIRGDGCGANRHAILATPWLTHTKRPVAFRFPIPERRFNQTMISSIMFVAV